MVKCRRIKQAPIETPAILELPYHSRQFLGESIDAFKSTALKWMRLGPILAFLLLVPMWMNCLSGLYVCLQPSTVSNLSSLDFHQFLTQCSEGLMTLIGTGATTASEAIFHFSQNQWVIFAMAASFLGFTAYVQRLAFKPNLLIADNHGLNLVIRLGEISVPLARVPWRQVKGIGTYQSGSADQGKIRIKKENGKKLDLDLKAIGVENRNLLLKRIEKLVPDCQIEPELSQAMRPKSDRSYTEIWLQSLNQSPERKTLEPLEPGQIVGENRFEVLHKLGIGGQGTAYLCRPLGEDGAPNVVLKETILPVFVDETVRRKALESFEREARLLKSLNNAGIVELLDYFVEDHRAYLVLEHIDGSNLRELVINNAPLRTEQVCDIALQACTILKFLHDNSIVHRDFTPDNLILNSSGKVKLIDFNVAQQIQSGSTGTIVGKHAYLPPEQFRGKATTQSDLYALGSTLFFLLTGKDPEPISQSSPRTVDSTINESLDAVVKRATALQTNNRYQTAAAIEKDLLKLEAEPAVEPAVVHTNLVRDVKDLMEAPQSG